jgi:molybdopterin converting factor subunit 1
MNILVQYFAIFRQKRGLSEENISVDSSFTAADLYSKIAKQYDFNLPLVSIRIAINDEFCTSETQLNDQDKIVFIPPVSGG